MSCVLRYCERVPGLWKRGGSGVRESALGGTEKRVLLGRGTITQIPKPRKMKDPKMQDR